MQAHSHPCHRPPMCCEAASAPALRGAVGSRPSASVQSGQGDLRTPSPAGTRVCTAPFPVLGTRRGPLHGPMSAVAGAGATDQPCGPGFQLIPLEPLPQPAPQWPEGERPGHRPRWAGGCLREPVRQQLPHLCSIPGYRVAARPGGRAPGRGRGPRLVPTRCPRRAGSHLYGCSPVCVLRCLVRFADRGKIFPQYLGWVAGATAGGVRLVAQVL